MTTKGRFVAVGAVLALAMFMVCATARADLVSGLKAYDAKDYPTALKELKPLAEQGNPRAQYIVGVMHLGGKGVAKDPKQALDWIAKSADNGYKDAQFILGAMHFGGHGGVAKDLKLGAAWYRKAAEQGHVKAQFILGLCYKFGQGVAQDEKQMIPWFRKAAEQGFSRAQSEMGVNYYKGRGGLPQDLVKAYAWTSLAAAQGNQGARNNLQVFAKNMTPEQIAEAKQVAGRLVGKYPAGLGPLGVDGRWVFYIEPTVVDDDLTATQGPTRGRGSDVGRRDSGRS